MRWARPPKVRRADPFEAAVEDASLNRWQGSIPFAERVTETVLRHQERQRIEALWRLGRVNLGILTAKIGELFCAIDSAEVRAGMRGVHYSRRSKTRRRRERRQVAELVEELCRA